ACGATLLLLWGGAAPAEEHTVHAIAVRGFETMFFEPDFVRAQPGDSVTFIVDDLDHQPQSVFVPTGAADWQAEQGQSITVELTEEGVYIFDCAFHNVMGMAGVILVGDPVNLVDARAFYERYRDETIFIEKDRLDHVWDEESGVLGTAR
ncbi:MAG: plastocyanin/azurin family copper-binding protein, partial [Pseudomonadota bacterium]